MSARKNKDPGSVRKLHPQQSFRDMVADATLAKLGGYLDQQVSSLGQELLRHQAKAVENVILRILAIEGVLLDNIAGLTKDQLAQRVADVQDKNEGFTAVDGAAELGDRVRLEIKTKTSDQTEYQGSSRMLIDNTGSGNTLGKELEGAIIGMSAGESKEIVFGKDGSLSASLTINKVSRPPAQASEEAPIDATAGAADEAPDSATQTAAQADTQESPSANIDAG